VHKLFRLLPSNILDSAPTHPSSLPLAHFQSSTFSPSSSLRPCAGTCRPAPLWTHIGPIILYTPFSPFLFCPTLRALPPLFELICFYRLYVLVTILLIAHLALFVLTCQVALLSALLAHSSAGLLRRGDPLWLPHFKYPLPPLFVVFSLFPFFFLL